MKSNITKLLMASALVAGNEIKINTGKTYVGFVPVDDWLDLVIE